MKKFIAYFDFLGFSDFIEKNDSAKQHKVMRNIYLAIENALANWVSVKNHAGFYNPDISKSTLSTLNFSDTVIFITQDDSMNSFLEIMKVAFEFNSYSIRLEFPVRGCIVYDEIFFTPFNQKNQAGGVYHLTSVYGKGLVKAHIIANSQDWAGTIVEKSAIDYVNALPTNTEIEPILEEFTKRYHVPFKNGDKKEEYVLRITKGDLDDMLIENLKKNIANNFIQYNKSIEDSSVKQKLHNTLEFIESFRNEKKG
ncbi:hypothetical protein [Sporocytophaga myxococcoides]|nr:hypothetical protein [Sporocytophaga myxococcoides]